ncbi:hypothetical protein D0T49_12105 [Paludibacter sp. 221]|uniref:hypothetical protein n=1 Tax=Paludibacter sp. 221 TaxID=2302939 RepID=UPI0013D0DDD4|nr:hypothetical protein [Paludibacter sp. 221]NDV47789.1 hypothetical protein [Paludibacter sp. 221]
MATANLNNEPVQVVNGNDNVVIVDNFQSVRGGRTLDVSAYPAGIINAGHVIICETATGEYKPMPLSESGDAYTALPASHTYAGILAASITTAKPFAAIMVRGTVNPAAAPFPMDTIMAAVKAALPLIDFRED